MLQFLAFRKNLSESDDINVPVEINMLKFGAILKLMLKRIFYLLLLIYSTFFIAAIDLPWSIEWSLSVGGFICSIFLIRIINDIIKMKKFAGGKIIIDENGITVETGEIKYHSNASDITYCEVNLLSNLVIREKYRSISIPLMFIDANQKEKLLNCFIDMSPKRTKMFKKIYEIYDALLVAFILAMHIRHYIIQTFYIPSSSMEDTLQVGDQLIAEKITYGPTIPKMIFMDKPIHLSCLSIRPVKRGDIIIFKPPGVEDKDYIKRCIAVEGDELYIKNGAVYVNGKKLYEPYVKGITTCDLAPDPYLIQGVVPKGMVVALGDNRENSQDSRYFGYVPVENIKARAWILYFNTKNIMQLDFSRFGLIK